MSQQVPTSQSSSAAYRNFINTCRSIVTRKHYTRPLEYFMKFLKLDNYDRILDMDPKILQMNICDYVVFLRSNNLAPRSIANRTFVRGYKTYTHHINIFLVYQANAIVIDIRVRRAILSRKR